MSSFQGAVALFAVLAAVLPSAVAAEPSRYPSPQAAVEALIDALEAGDRSKVLAVFGEEYEDIYSTGNAEEDRAIWGDFLQDLSRVHRIEIEEEDLAVLLTGPDFAAFPAAILRDGEAWSFDSEGAREEIRFRRIEENELAVIDIMDRAGSIQEAYRRIDHDGDGVKEFAAGILSSAGQRDGLYWPSEPGTSLSPFDETIARASFDGFGLGDEDFEPQPYEGYYFRILQGQGASAPGGAYSYLVNGNMVAGHALLAVPAAHGDSGIMTFIVSESGVIYEADLGDTTLETAAGVYVFDPGEGWTAVDLED